MRTKEELLEFLKKHPEAATTLMEVIDKVMRSPFEPPIEDLRVDLPL
jgi:mRNA-degrading endonuclease HigB of HigAB toxin-antitoxin module